MIKKLNAFVASAVMLISLSACSLTKTEMIETVHETEIPPKMLFLGDSIAAGYGLEGYSADDLYSCQSYANILNDKYSSELPEESGQQMINKAVSGATSDDLIELLNSGQLDEALKNSDAVVVSIGGNDLLGSLYGLIGKLGFSAESGNFDLNDIDIFSALAALSAIESDINKALDELEPNIIEISTIINEKSDGTLFIQTLYNPLEYFSDISMVTDFSSEKLDRFNDIIIRNSGENTYRVVDVAAEFKGRNGTLTNISSIDIHPNAEGHTVIADTVDTAFRSIGFSYITMEEGDKRMTLSGILLILGGILAVVLLLIVLRRKDSSVK